MPDSKDTLTEASDLLKQPVIPVLPALPPVMNERDMPEQLPDDNEAIRMAGERARLAMNRMYEALDLVRESKQD